MDDENKRIEIADLPKAAEQLTDEEAQNVEGGLSKVGAGTLVLGNANTYNQTTNTAGGSLLDANTKMGDGSV